MSIWLCLCYEPAIFEVFPSLLCLSHLADESVTQEHFECDAVKLHKFREAHLCVFRYQMQVVCLGLYVGFFFALPDRESRDIYSPRRSVAVSK